MIKDVSEGMSNIVPTTRYVDKGVRLENILTSICNDLGRVGNLTNNNADVDFLVGVVGSYLISKHEGKLGSDYKPPSDIFNDILFPQIESMELEVQEIAEDEDILLPNMVDTCND